LTSSPGLPPPPTTRPAICIRLTRQTMPLAVTKHERFILAILALLVVLIGLLLL
jgi:hypothetical protein